MRGRLAIESRVAAALAVFALVLGVVLPPGTMVARTSAGGPALVICTGHGALSVPKAPAPAGPHKACPFAIAVATGVAAEAPPALFVPALTYAPPPPGDRPAPGAGLAAPPPPSHGPPVLLA